MTDPGIRSKGAPPRIVFSSDHLPAGLDERARFSAWRDMFTGIHGELDLSCLPDRPFSGRMVCTAFGALRLARFDGTMDRVARRSRNIAADRGDDFFIGLNRGKSRLSFSQMGREAILDTGTAVLCSKMEARELRAKSHNSWSILAMPRCRVQPLVAGAEDLVARPLDPGSLALRHLRRYLEILPGPAEIEDDPALVAHVETTLFDLVALALGACRDAAEIARLRGLRAARLREAVAEIKTSFADPAFSGSDVAAKLGVSLRYVQNLLWDTGASFTDRIRELRLQKARAMLAQRQYDRLKIIDIVYACGFNEVSYFNRCFRRRFGASPTQYRGGNGADSA